MKRSRLGPGDAAAGRLDGEDPLGRGAEGAGGGRGDSGTRAPWRRRGLRPCASPGCGECRARARTPALRRLGPRRLRARPAAKARVTCSRPTRQAWELRGRAGDFWGEGAPRPEGRPGSQLPKAKARYDGRRRAALSRLSVLAPSGFLLPDLG